MTLIAKALNPDTNTVLIKSGFRVTENIYPNNFAYRKQLWFRKNFMLLVFSVKLWKKKYAVLIQPAQSDAAAIK